MAMTAACAESTWVIVRFLRAKWRREQRACKTSSVATTMKGAHANTETVADRIVSVINHSGIEEFVHAIEVDTVAE
jgi:hypothetical protein